MAISKALTGARCKMYVNGQLAGVFSNASYGVNYSVEPIYILGRYDAAENTYTSMAPVDVQVSGFRVVENGPYAIGNVPKLQDLLFHEDIYLTIVDRQTGKTVMTVTGVRPTGFNTGNGARALVDLSVSFTGLGFLDENNENDSDIGAVDFG